MKNEPKSTYEKFIEDEEQKRLLDQDFRLYSVSQFTETMLHYQKSSSMHHTVREF